MQVSDTVEEVFARLDPLRATTEKLLTAPTGSADLDRLRPDVVATLGGLVVGAGFIAATGALTDAELGFEWWTTTPDGPPTQLFISLDPASEYFLDYTRQSWFTVPRDTGRRHVTGPYVDYLCTDEYTLTFSVPVRRGGVFAGVVGADVFVREFERLLMPGLRTLINRVGGRAALVNAQGRVIASSSVRQATGSLVREPDIPGWWSSGAPGGSAPARALRRCGDAPMALLLTSR
ncbi:MAG TPA: cache domain-containing protein [Pseudonocardia sp.]